MGAHDERGRRRFGRRPAPAGAVVPAGSAGNPRLPGPRPQGRDGHPSRCLTVVHDGADQVDTVSLWLAAPRTAHPGDQVGWPRGGLAPSATYTIALGRGGYLGVVGGTLAGWLDGPGEGPLLTPAGELDERVLVTEAPNVLPLRPRPVVAAPGAGALPRQTGPGASSVELTCPCRNPGGLRLADRLDEQRELDRVRREQATARALAVAEQLLVDAVLMDGSPDVDVLVAGVRRALAGELAVGPFAQRVATGVPGPVMSAVLRSLLADASASAAEEADFRVAFRMLAQRALSIHGDAVLDVLPARFVADGMAAEALVRPRLEQLLDCPLPGDLGRLARWSLHGMDGTFGEVDPCAVEITLLAMGAVIR